MKELDLAKNISNKISKKVNKDRKEPTGNQNCLLCTWCSEAQFRGINILPRPVYSPRDVIFKYTNAEIVKYHRKMYFKNIDELIKKILKGERYYCHINWKNSKGGHEFLLLNINNEIYVMDSQDGLVETLKNNNYFNNINFKNSFIVRLDNKILNNDILKYNDNKYILEFNEKTDLKYLK
ncbi:MAG: hypothetical protein IKX00_03885 [Bacilli bacterium]|nr:hypothetical protein [Bacilli bacterium]